MGKIDSAGYSLSDKFDPARELLAQNEDNGENWTLEDLIESLQKYTERNHLKDRNESRDSSNRRSRDYSQRRDNINSQNTKILIRKPQHG